MAAVSDLSPAELLATHDLVDLSVSFGEEYSMAFPGHQPFRHKVLRSSGAPGRAIAYLPRTS